jgi:hypothetical protein
MTSILGRIFGRKPAMPPALMPGDVAFSKAMTETRKLREKMRECSASTDVARALMADIWFQNHNVPFLTTVYEGVQEMKSGTDQKPQR